MLKLSLVFIMPMLLLFQNDLLGMEAKTGYQDQPVVEKLIEMGYKRERIEELENFYLVQGDLLFSKNINDYKEKGVYDRHASTHHLVSQYNVTNMTVYVDPSIPASGSDNWRNAINFAINDWNSVAGSKVKFILSTYANSDITIRSDAGQLPYNAIASAGFPTNYQPYNTILINLDFWFNTNVGEGSKRYNMVHELGHSIGFRHTNWDIRGENIGYIGANEIPGTPLQDPNSVMNGGTANYSWDGFSYYDIISVNYLYPKQISSPRLSVKISGPDYMPGGVNLITWRYRGGVSNPRSYTWWYKIKNSMRAAVAIGRHSNGTFFAVPNTDNPTERNSYFEIYLVVSDTQGNRYISNTVTILKKGKYQLVSAI